MGVLDDAIREHLELKRRHGAGEDEVRRQEEEALGPARREVAPAESDDGNGAEAQAEHADVPAADEPAVAEAAAPEAGAAETAAPETVPHDEVHPDQAELGETPQQGFERVEEEDVPGDFTEEEELAEDDDFEELEGDDGHPEGDDEEYEEDEDVLEETPDFLQETPEHDRLWFEQKPPRDFDFD
jgi:hypothetical protein